MKFSILSFSACQGYQKFTFSPWGYDALLYGRVKFSAPDSATMQNPSGSDSSLSSKLAFPRFNAEHRVSGIVAHSSPVFILLCGKLSVMFSHISMKMTFLALINSRLTS